MNKNEKIRQTLLNKKLSKVYLTPDKKFIEIINSNNKWRTIAKELGYFNGGCSSNIKRAIRNRCEELNISLNIDKKECIDNLTKGELFNKRKNWQSARSGIVKHASRVYYLINKLPKCVICGYNKCVEVAHIRAVADFDDNVLIKEINDINNLIGLCPNHHWEYDHGLLKL